MSDITGGFEMTTPSLIVDLKEALQNDGCARWIQQGDRCIVVMNGKIIMEGPMDQLWEDQFL